MQHAQDFDVVGVDAVERQIGANDEVPDGGPDIRPCGAGIGLGRQETPTPPETFDQFIGGSRTVERDVIANRAEIALGLRRKPPFHLARLPASARNFALILSSAASPSTAGPLSIPACASARNSSIV